MDRLLRDTQPTISVALVGGTGVAVDPDPGFENLVKVTITKSDGSALVTNAAATNDAGAGNYSYTLLVADTSVLDVYTARWDATIGGALQKFRTAFEIVGGFIVSTAEVRAFDPDLASTDDYPHATVVRIREAAEEWLEELLGYGLRPRGRRATLSGNGTRKLIVPDQYPSALISAGIDYGSGFETFTASHLTDTVAAAEGIFERRTLGHWPSGYQNVQVFYEHGFTEAPEPIRQCALELIRERLVQGAIPARATATETEAGTFRLSIAGREGPTGIPYVDSILAEFGRRLPAVG